MLFRVMYLNGASGKFCDNSKKSSFQAWCVLLRTSYFVFLGHGGTDTPIEFFIDVQVYLQWKSTSWANVTLKISG